MKSRPVIPAVFVIMAAVVVIWALSIDFGPAGLFYFRHLSLLFAALGLVLIFLQFAFVSRVKFIEAGFGLDRLLRLHRLCGRLGLAMLILHAALIIFFRLRSFGDLFFTSFVWIGAAVLAGLMVTAALASLHRVLGLAYETWRNIHLFNYLLFPLVLIHVFYHTDPRSPLYYLWLVLTGLYVCLVLYRLYAMIMLRSNPYTVTAVKKEAEGIFSLIFEGPGVNFKPGQFLFIQLLRGGRLSSPHPFTISAGPGAGNLAITPKELGDFTSTIKETRVGDRAFIDAPYGVFSFLNYKHDKLVFVAGGIGITPFISMLRYISEQKLDTTVTLFWANRSEEQLCFRAELEEMASAMPGFTFVPIMSDQPDWPGEKGRLSGNVILQRLGSLEGAGFFVCGPPPMIRAIIAELKELEVPAVNIHSELFEL